MGKNILVIVTFYFVIAIDNCGLEFVKRLVRLHTIDRWPIIICGYVGHRVHRKE